MNSEQIRVTVHAEALKFGRVPDLTHPTLKEQLKDSSLAEEAERKGITEIGYRLTYAQNRALFVVQQLLDETNYKGNDRPQKPRRGLIYHFNGTLPVLNIKTSEYIEAFGVKKVRHSGKSIFNPQPRRIAVNALKDLGVDEHLLVYDKSRSPKGKKKVRVEVINPLLKLEWLNKNRRVRIIPNPVLVDHIDSYFLLKPVDLFQQIPDKDPIKVRFLEYLHYHALQKLRQMVRIKTGTRELRVEVETIAAWLRLDAMLKARKQSALRKRLTDLYAFGVRSGYLESFDIDQQATKKRIVDVLRLSSTVWSKI